MKICKPTLFFMGNPSIPHPDCLTISPFLQHHSQPMSWTHEQILRLPKPKNSRQAEKERACATRVPFPPLEFLHIKDRGLRITVMDLHSDEVQASTLSTDCLELKGRHCPSLESLPKSMCELWTDGSPLGHPVTHWVRILHPKPGYKFHPLWENHLLPSSLLFIRFLQ